MATEQNYYGGDYRTWANVKGRPERKQYAASAMRYHVFPEDNLHYLADPAKPFNFYWHSKKARFDDELDDLMDKGYVRVIVDGPNANFTNPVRDGGGERWRRGPEGTVISRLGELWAQPAEIGIALEDEERRRLNPKAKNEEIEANLRGTVDTIRREAGVDMYVVDPKAKSKK